MAIVKNKAVVKLGVTDAKSERAVKKVIVELGGITSHALNFEKSTLVVIGDTDPTLLVNNLRKIATAKLVTYGPETGERPQRQQRQPVFVKNKAVVKLGVTDAKSEKAAKKALKEIDGITSHKLDHKKWTLVVIGDTDPTWLVNKLRKFVRADLVTFGPVMDEGKPQKNDGRGGNVARQQPQRSQWSQLLKAAAAVLAAWQPKKP